MRLLLIDDDVQVLRATARLLHRLGYDVFEAAESLNPEIWALLGMVDAVVTDWDMPGANGLDVLRECQRLAPGLPVLVFSGEHSRETTRAAIAAGACGWVLKPGVDQLLLTLAFLEAGMAHPYPVGDTRSRAAEPRMGAA